MAADSVGPNGEKLATLKDVRDFFGQGTAGLKGFTDEWKLLSSDDKLQIRIGLGNGSLTY